MSLVVILLSIIIIILLASGGFLLWHYRKLNQQIDTLLEKGNIKDLREALMKHFEKTKELEASLKVSQKHLHTLDAIAQTSFQKMAVIRFNPFKDLGGDQSFVLAILDGKNDGIVISSFFNNNKNTIYAKLVKNGTSKHLLSKEEEQALNQAINND